MSIPLSDNTNQLLISQLQIANVIQYQSEHVKRGIYYIFNIENDSKIPAILLQLWKIDGGYDHAFANVLEVGLGMNKQVPIFEPQKNIGIIDKIMSYRPITENLSDKEEFFFDVWPNSTSEIKDDKHKLPFECEVLYRNIRITLIIAQWTPLQKIPVDKIKIGTEVEFWIVGNEKTLIRIIKL